MGSYSIGLAVLLSVHQLRDGNRPVIAIAKFSVKNGCMLSWRPPDPVEVIAAELSVTVDGLP